MTRNVTLLTTNRNVTYYSYSVLIKHNKILRLLLVKIYSE